MPLEGHWARQHGSRASDTVRERRAMLAVAALLVAVVVAVGAVALTSGSRHTARGCIDVTVASTTGGAMLHACGRQAVRLCRGELPIAPGSAGELRRRCRDAGLASAVR